MQNKTTSRIGLLLVIITVGFLAGIGGSLVVYFVVIEDYMHLSQEQKPQTIINEVTQLQDDATIDVVEQTTGSVVSVIAKKDIPQYGQLFNTPYGLFYKNPSQPSQKQKIGGGTGFFMSQDGMIITNKHVVEDVAAEYSVITSNNKEYPAKVLARDDSLDFAVLKIEPQDNEVFKAAKLGNSDSLKIGQTVIAIGNSLGEFSHSVSRGIVSGVKRDIVAGSGYGKTEQLTDIIQTDAAINPGNSGGPLIDMEGNVIGINTAVAQGAENIGFAIPINQVAKLIDEVKRTGTLSSPFIGVRYVAVTPQIAQELDLPYDDKGVVIVRGRSGNEVAVLPNSPADKAGLMEGDVILQIDGRDITTENTLAKEIEKYIAGDTITVKVWRDGKAKEIVITLEDKKSLNSNKN